MLLTRALLLLLLASLLVACAVAQAVPEAVVVGRHADDGPDSELHVRAPVPHAELSTRHGLEMWDISYYGAPPPPFVRSAVEYAARLLSLFFEIKVPIRARFAFGPLGENLEGNQILGQARSAVWWPVRLGDNYQSLPIALANTITGRDQLSQFAYMQQVDIIASFNSDAPFYYATDDSKPPSGQFDFVTVLLHELLHGMGFIGGLTCRSPCNVAFPELELPPPFTDYISSYDMRIVNERGERLVDVWRLRGRLGLAEYYSTSKRLYLYVNDTDEEFVELFAPNHFLSGNSVYHIAESYKDADSLMRYAVAPGQVVHSLGLSTLRVMQAVGWEISPEAIRLSKISSSVAYVPSLFLLLALLLSLELYYLYLA